MSRKCTQHQQGKKTLRFSPGDVIKGQPSFDNNITLIYWGKQQTTVYFPKQQKQTPVLCRVNLQVKSGTEYGNHGGSDARESLVGSGGRGGGRGGGGSLGSSVRGSLGLSIRNLGHRWRRSLGLRRSLRLSI
ncbi:hypothetical protein J3458_000299 [Metarhizium acridum]|uniref:uncharacterized protein n=1 Tax=Metarhizium acridum TaxID=92637 RepID=UPI001C6CA018|nr:hypothetical protein J3458_000299 [Metarhizium acridum]